MSTMDASGSGAIACMINGEIGTVLAVVRRNSRRYLASDDNSLEHSLKSLRRSIFEWRQAWNEIDPSLYLQPFLDLICSTEASAPITSVALSAVYNILSFEVFDGQTVHAAEAMHCVVEAVTNCEFKVIDPSSEEVVLMKVLQVFLAVMKHATSKLLSDRDLCLVFNSCFRVVQQSATKGEILQRTARHSIHEIVRVLFARLPQLHQSHTVSSTHVSVLVQHPDVNSGVELHAKRHNGIPINVMISPVDSPADKPKGLSECEAHHGEASGSQPQSYCIESYGIAGIVEIFRSLCSLLDFHTVTGRDLRAIDEDVPLFALGLINSAVILAGAYLGLYIELLTIVQDDLFRSLMHLALTSKNPLILSIICSVVLNLYHHHRRHLKLQLESFFSCVIVRLAQGKHGGTYQQQEAAMELLVSFCRQPTFMAELYVNFDCNILCRNLYEELGSLLSKSAFPVNCPLSTLHVLSLEGLIAVIHCIADRSSSAMTIPEPYVDIPVCDFVPFWTVKCNSYEDTTCWVEFIQKQKFTKQKLMLGVDHFNRDIKKGFEFLQGIHLLPEKLDPSSVACFFRFTPGLDKTVVGDFLGDPDEFALQVLEEFTRTFDFRGMSLDIAMRIFLETFRLPGEAQKIHRVLEAFAARYHEQSPQVLADKDAAFLLAYSVILLNTDQHNSQVKKKMSEEDFIRNNRGINGGQDLPRDYLSNLYKSIVKNEIKMSYASGIGMAEMTPSRWVSLVYKSRYASPYILCDSRPWLDHEMFALISGPAVAAISVVFDYAEDEEVLNLCEDGFMIAAKVASSYHVVEVLDDLVVSLCKFTGLVNPVGSNEELLVSFNEDVKACLAAVTAFKIANLYGDYVRASWGNIVDCVVQFHKLGLLPAHVSSVAAEVLDMRGDSGIGRPVIGGTGAVSAGSRKRTTGLIGRFSQLLSLESEEPEMEPTEEQLAAHQRTLTAIESCRIDSIITESKFLQVESLLQLAKALVSVADRSQKVGSSFEDEATAVFCLDLLIAVVLHNRDRILLLWHGIYEHIANIVQTAALPSPLVEKAVFGLLRICQRLLPYKEELGEELLRSLQVILKLDARVADALCERITQEVKQLVKANARHIKTAVSWRTVSSLLSITARHLEASEVGFEALSFIMQEGAHLTQVNYILFLEAARAFAETSIGGVDRSLCALDLMSGSAKCLIKWRGQVILEGSYFASDAKKCEELGEMWVRLVQGVRKLVVDPREQIRNFAVLSLQRCLSAGESIHLPALLMGQVFDQILFTMLDELLEIAVKHSSKEYCNMETTLLLAIKMVSKVFLQSLEQLSSLPGFPAIWSAVLNHMGRYMKMRMREQGCDNKLQECIPELLKNMLLVMRARGVLVEGSTLDGYTLWELTWHYVRGIAPLLEQELHTQETTRSETVLVEAVTST
ncbi:hypothetical protein L7F22_045992 [Adiantum nelumboides]|nr:hypothetical protein [Adiantum nelumboides]